MNFNGILIGTDDPKRLTEFYTKVLGAPIYDQDGYSAWQIGTGSIAIGAHSEVHGRNPSPGRLIWNIETKNVKEHFEKFKAAGATVIRAPYEMEGAPGSQIATFEDPDGNYFQLATPMEM
jgi:predicted enzyme related to lactoylglutathione lyase